MMLASFGAIGAICYSQAAQKAALSKLARGASDAVTPDGCLAPGHHASQKVLARQRPPFFFAALPAAWRERKILGSPRCPPTPARFPLPASSPGRSVRLPANIQQRSRLAEGESPTILVVTRTFHLGHAAAVMWGMTMYTSDWRALCVRTTVTSLFLLSKIMGQQKTLLGGLAKQNESTLQA